MHVFALLCTVKKENLLPIQTSCCDRKELPRVSSALVYFGALAAVCQLCSLIRDDGKRVAGSIGTAVYSAVLDALIVFAFSLEHKKKKEEKKKSLQNKTPATDNGVGANHFLVSTACFKTAQMQQSRVLVRLMLCWLCCIFTPRQLIRSSPSAAPACERWLPRPCRRCSDPASVHSAYLRSLTDMY